MLGLAVARNPYLNNISGCAQVLESDLGVFGSARGGAWKPLWRDWRRARLSLLHGFMPFSPQALGTRLAWLSLCALACVLPLWYEYELEDVSVSQLNETRSITLRVLDEHCKREKVPSSLDHVYIDAVSGKPQ